MAQAARGDIAAAGDGVKKRRRKNIGGAA